MKTLDKILSHTRMKAIVLFLSLLLPSFISCSPVYYSTAEPQQGYVTFQLFYDDLSPYGQWVDYSPYGYVWIPDAGPDFFPYMTNGYWIWTDFGWTWMSDYSWGWAPFHYGRWDFDDLYGWFWVPDEVWGPCWVTWRRADGYYGWAPMRPGISIDVSFRGGYRDDNRWCFVTDRDFDRHDLSHYYVDRRENDRLLSNSTVITNTYVDQSRNVTYVAGPKRDAVQRVTGRRVPVAAIRDNDRPGERLAGGELQIYRPRVERVTRSNEIPAPRKITDLNEVRRAGRNNPANEGNAVQPGENNRREIRQEPQNNINREPANINREPAVVEPQRRPETEKNINREPAPVEPQRREIEKPVPSENKNNQLNRVERQNRETPPNVNNRRQENQQRPAQPSARQKRIERSNRRNSRDQ